jgi:replicative DNA helicase
MLRENGVIIDVLEVVGADSFYIDAHQKIFKAIESVFAGRKPVDLVILTDTLKTQGLIEDVGGYAYLGDLWDAAPTAANCVFYAKIVRDKYLVRQLILTCTEVLRDAYEESQPPDDLLLRAQRDICAIADTRASVVVTKLDAEIRNALNEIDQRRGGEMSGVPSGFADVDGLTDGFQAGELILIGARPSVGKTAIGVNIARHAAGVGKSILFLSMEQATKEIAFRLLAGESRINSLVMRRGNLRHDQAIKIADASGVLSPLPIWFNDSGNQTSRSIYTLARRFKNSNPLDMIVMDYVQLISGLDSRQGRHEQLSEVSRSLKHMAREFNIPVIALAQLNRKSEDREEPKLSDLKDSGSLEQDADVVILLHRLDAQDDGAEIVKVQARVAKQRNGPVGSPVLAYNRASMRFENYAEMPTR